TAAAVGRSTFSEARVAEPAWYLIVLSWNGREDTERCLDALAKVSEPPVRVVCVDNGSTDGSVEAVRDRHPEVHLIENGRNLGFAGGCNVGIRWALTQGAEWLVLVNNDAVIRRMRLRASPRRPSSAPRPACWPESSTAPIARIGS